MAAKKKKVIKKPQKKAKKKAVAAKRPAAKTRPAKKPVKKAVSPKKKRIAKKPSQPVIEGTIAGKITHYFGHVNAAVIKLKSPLKVNDKIRIKGHTTDFEEEISSMQINHVPVNEAKPGDEIGLLVKSRVRAGDTVYKI